MVTHTGPQPLVVVQAALVQIWPRAVRERTQMTIIHRMVGAHSRTALAEDEAGLVLTAVPGVVLSYENACS
jgi:hypothetical protein